MTTYKAPASDLAVSLREDSYRKVAVALGESGPDSCELLARHHVAKINASLRSLQRHGQGHSPEAHALRRQRARLREQPSAVFLYTQQRIDGRFGELIERAETWLAGNDAAVGMLDRSHLLRFLGGVAGSDRRPTPRLFAEAAKTIQVVSQFGEGFTASAANAEFRALAINEGVYDGISAATRLIVGSTVRFLATNQLRVRNLRERPALFSKVRDRLKSILDQAREGQTDPAIRIPAPVDDPSRQIADELQWGAEAFVILHELAHVLLPTLPASHEEEHKSDRFAALAIAGCKNPVLITGMGLGLLILITILRQTNRHRLTESHPAIVRRYNLLLSELHLSSAAIGPWLDALLTAPNRLVEEEAFRVETAPAIRLNFQVRLVEGWRNTPPGEAARAVACAIVDRGLRLPALSESTAHTLWIHEESGQRSMALMVDLLPALDAARAALATHGSTDADVHAELAAEATLRLIAMLTYSGVPPLSAVRALNALTYAGPKVPPTDAQWREGLPYLEELACIRPGRRGGELQQRVPITFYADPGGF